MYGLIGKFKCVEGKRDELIGILTADVGEMPGCLSYVVAKDLDDPDSLWITEVWENQASHRASLQIPEVKAAIGAGMLLIDSFDMHVTTEPVGGIGLKSAKDESSGLFG